MLTEQQFTAAITRLRVLANACATASLDWPLDSVQCHYYAGLRDGYDRAAAALEEADEAAAAERRRVWEADRGMFAAMEDEGLL